MILQETNPPASVASIRAFEKAIGMTLPDDYRLFLEENNGGEQPTPEQFRMSNGESSFVACFFPIGDGTNRDVLGFQRFLENTLPSGVFPIGEDLGGNYLCIPFSGENKGKVFLLDHEIINHPMLDPWRKLIFCSNSFQEFVENLY